MRQHKRRTGFSFLAGAALGLLLSMTGFLALRWFLPAQGPLQAPGNLLTQPAPMKPLHVLVLGVDEREGDFGRSDSMLLVRVENAGVRVLSIPRDTLVDLGEFGEGKVNSAYTYGGPDLAKQAVSELMDIPVDYYVKVNMSGFRDLVDLVGGVRFDVPKAMRYTDPTDGLVIDLRPGPQLMDGEKAEQFVRFRHDAIGDDVGRIHRQQEFLKAFAEQALSRQNLPKLPQLLYTARSHVETDIPLTEQLKLAQVGYSAQQRDAIVQETLPGHGDYVNGVSFFLIDQQQMKMLLDRWNGH